ncbi:MAG: hypothetical protein JXA22_05650 [Candidatus Thermoplasmatota archaeon]|nr:hypothetical protein [Candidatus Thermoplasmatota archaeon]
MEPEEKEDVNISLPVRRSRISSVEGGIARLHHSHLDMFRDEEMRTAVIRHGKKHCVVKLVGDEIAPTDVIILRSGDMKHLGIDEGDVVEVEPYHEMTGELRETWQKFVSRFERTSAEND